MQLRENRRPEALKVVRSGAWRASSRAGGPPGQGGLVFDEGRGLSMSQQHYAPDVTFPEISLLTVFALAMPEKQTRVCNSEGDQR